MRRLVLHLGLHKTGTTTIQKACRQNGRRLTSVGYAYPLVRVVDPATGRESRDANHSGLLLALARGGTAEGQVHVREPGTRYRFRETLLRAIPAGHSLLLVGEEGSRLSATELAELRDFFVTAGFHIDVYCTIRSPLSWLNSMVAQRVIGPRGPRETMRFVMEEFSATGGVVMPRVRNILSAFPNASFSSFGETTKHPQGPAGHFFDEAGIPLPRPLRQPEVQNEGHSDASVRLADAINSATGARYASRENEILFSTLRARCPVLYSLPGPKFHLRASELEPLLGFVRAENEELLSRFGAGFHDEALQLSDEPPAFTAQHVAMLSAHLESFPPQVRRVVRGILAQAGA